MFDRYKNVEGVDYISIARAQGKNYKGQLQELLMKSNRSLPRYTDVTLETGEFLVTVTVEEKVLGKAIHNSKKQAQIEAAKIALEQLTQ